MSETIFHRHRFAFLAIGDPGPPVTERNPLCFCDGRAQHSAAKCNSHLSSVEPQEGQQLSGSVCHLTVACVPPLALMKDKAPVKRLSENKDRAARCPYGFGSRGLIVNHLLETSQSCLLLVQLLQEYSVFESSQGHIKLACSCIYALLK